jgi:Transcriptional regulatory protein, C terminal
MLSRTVRNSLATQHDHVGEPGAALKPAPRSGPGRPGAGPSGQSGTGEARTGDELAAAGRPGGRGGTLLAVVPVNGGSAAMAIVGYLLPRAPGPADGTVRPSAAVGPASRLRPAAARPAAAHRDAGQPPAQRPARVRAPAMRLAGSRPAHPAPDSAGRPAMNAAGQPAVDRAAAASAGAGLVLDTAGRRFLIDGRDIGLVYLEFELFQFLVRNPGRALSREHVFRSVWGEEPLESSRTVDIHVHRIRRKLGPVYSRRLVTVRRIGYRYEPAAAI